MTNYELNTTEEHDPWSGSTDGFAKDPPEPYYYELLRDPTPYQEPLELQDFYPSSPFVAYGNTPVKDPPVDYFPEGTPSGLPDSMEIQQDGEQ